MAKHLRIEGLVQGIGYRVAFSRQARALLLSGWVRNRLDGSVEAMVAGDAVALQQIVDWSRRGPPGARVSKVEAVDFDDAQVQLGKFEKLPTA